MEELNFLKYIQALYATWNDAVYSSMIVFIGLCHINYQFKKNHETFIYYLDNCERHLKIYNLVILNLDSAVSG